MQTLIIWHSAHWNHFGRFRVLWKEKVYPIYIQVEDEQRLRAIKREKKQEHPILGGMPQIFADEEDFSEEKLQAAGITQRFLNNADREICMDKVASYIGTILEK